jgi:HK97 family phage major capsid protein
MDIDYEKIATLVADKMAAKEPPVKSAGVAMPEVMTRTEIMPQDCYLAYKTCAKLYPGEGFKNLEKEHQNPLKAYQKSFDKYLHQGERGLEPEDRHLLKAYKAALTEAGGAGGTAASEGAYWVAAQYLDQLVSAIAQQSYVRLAGARVVPMTALTMYVPSLTFSTFAALAATEEASYDEAEPTAGQVTFTAYKSTRIAKASDELVADAMFDIWTYILMPDFAQAFAANENKYMTTGTGSSQPEGCSYAAATGVTAASSTAITADEVINTKYALDFKYRSNAKWMAHDSTLKAIAKLKDGSGRYLWEPSWQSGQPDRLLGYPVITNSGMEEIAASKKVLLFGDFSYFWIGDREDLTIKRLDELYAASGQIAYRAYKRYDSHIMLAAGSTQLVMKA